MQYTRNEQDFSRGTFRVRGDTIDVFPAEHSELAIRIELFDDEIESLQLFDPLTGRIRQKMPRFTVYPSSHYVTPRDKVMARGRDHQARAGRAARRSSSSEGKLVEAQRLEQRTRFDLEMLTEIGHCKGIENYTRHLSGARAGRAAVHADRLPAQGRADVPGREPPDDRPARRHVQRRPRAQDDAGRVRLPPAVGAGQPAAEVRGVRDAHAPGDLRLGHAGRIREGPRRPGGRAAGAAHRPDRPGGRGAAGHAPGRRRAAGNPHPRREERARADHHADQAHGRAADRLPGRQRRQGALPAQRHRHGRARRDPARPAAGRLRRAGRHQPAARRAWTFPRCRWWRSSTPTRKASCAPSAR